jgi:Uma2 family endonuclease
VNCGDRPDGNAVAPNPVVVVEVTSPAPSVDTGYKLADYFPCRRSTTYSS